MSYGGRVLSKEIAWIDQERATLTIRDVRGADQTFTYEEVKSSPQLIERGREAAKIYRHLATRPPTPR